MFDFSEPLRLDITPIHMPKDMLAKTRRSIGKYRHAGEQATKPEYCTLCGRQSPKLCNSHSIPRFCLNQIAHKGEVDTINRSLDIDPLRKRIGINNAGVFRMICSDCDNKFFSEYENPELYKTDNPIASECLGRIATKVLLFEQNKARIQLGALGIVQDKSQLVELQEKTINTRTIDQIDNGYQLKYALNAVKQTNNGYRVLVDYLLDYTIPLAFQGEVCLISDFKGEKINNTLNMDESYHIEPLFICIFPLLHGSRIFVFCRADGYARYSSFHKQLRSLNQRKSLSTIFKIILCYSEEPLFSPLLSDDIFENEAFDQAARMNVMMISFFDHSEKQLQKKLRRDFAVEQLPDPPALLEKKYSMESLREQQHS